MQGAGAVFTLDMAKESLVLHSMHAEPVGGGQVFGSGRMLVAPWAEQDPGAVSIKAEGVELPTEELVRRYLPGEQRKLADLPCPMNATVMRSASSNASVPLLPTIPPQPNLLPCPPTPPAAAGAKLPPSLVLGKGNLTAAMKGSHMSPSLDIAFQVGALDESWFSPGPTVLQSVNST